jgi:hypothetical protein
VFLDDRSRTSDGQRHDEEKKLSRPVHSLPNVQDEPRPLGAVGSGVWLGSFFLF